MRTTVLLVAAAVVAAGSGTVRPAEPTPKRVEFTRQIVAGLGLAPLFATILGPDDVGRPKPDPAMVLEALRRLEVSAEVAVYVGDMAIDVQAGRAAGVPVWLVPGGAADPAEAVSAGADRMLCRFTDLLDLLPGPVV